MAEKVFVRDVPDELWKSLKAGAARRGVTVSRAVTEAIRKWLREEGPEKKGFPWRGITNLGVSGDTDISEAHDRALAAAVHERKSH